METEKKMDLIFKKHEKLESCTKVIDPSYKERDQAEVACIWKRGEDTFLIINNKDEIFFESELEQIINKMREIKKNV